MAHLFALTGGYPALLKVACRWWLVHPNRPPAVEWTATLLADRRIQYRLAEIWAGLTHEEHVALAEVQKLQAQAAAEKGEGSRVRRRRQNVLEQAWASLARQHQPALARLATKGLCQPDRMSWRIFSDLLAAYIVEAEGRSSGKIWLDEKTSDLYQGQALLANLTPLEHAVLLFLVKHPRLRHTKTELIVNAWPDELRREGVTDDSLYQMIMELRRKIEPNPAKPRYLITWRGKPEGGYRFFPDGKPG
jgi:DNA-binding winged helix-turn-helix (wHTH) protein